MSTVDRRRGPRGRDLHIGRHLGRAPGFWSSRLIRHARREPRPCPGVTSSVFGTTLGVLGKASGARSARLQPLHAAAPPVHEPHGAPNDVRGTCEQRFDAHADIHVRQIVAGGARVLPDASGLVVAARDCGVSTLRARQRAMNRGSASCSVTESSAPRRPSRPRHGRRAQT